MWIVVTGANRGLGLAATKTLALAGNHVVLACRDPKLGSEAIDDLVKSHSVQRDLLSLVQLDVANSDSRSASVAAFQKLRPEGYDVLLNNAAILGDKDAELLLNCNYRGLVRFTLLFKPHLRQDGPKRIVNVSSRTVLQEGARWTAAARDAFLKARNLDDIEAALVTFTKALARYRAGSETAMRPYGGYHPHDLYAASKFALNAASKLWHEEWGRGSDGGVVVSFCCPGWCRTRMGCSTGGDPPRSSEQGSEVMVWLATESTLGTHGGKFWAEKKELKLEYAD